MAPSTCPPSNDGRLAPWKRSFHASNEESASEQTNVWPENSGRHRPGRGGPNSSSIVGSTGLASGYTLRVSLTDRCQYRCLYCKPGSVTPYLNGSERLAVGDYRRLATAFAQLGVRKVRFTGGEPLLRDDLPEVVAAFRDALDCTLSLTTNGVLLPPRLPALRAAGLHGATIHVDSLQPDRYRALMGEGSVEQALLAVNDAKRSLAEVKINCVVQRGRNDDEISDFLALSRRLGVEVRFIELMNTGSAVAYTRAAFLSGREIVARVRAERGASPLPRRAAADPAALWRTDDGLTFGVIASDTESFCGACDRLRLSANGVLRGCLYESGGVDLGEPLRRADPGLLLAAVARAAASKQSFHPGVPGKRRLPFSMAEAGG